jgi:hypothetical protein
MSRASDPNNANSTTQGIARPASGSHVNPTTHETARFKAGEPKHVGQPTARSAHEKLKDAISRGRKGTKHPSSAGGKQKARKIPTPTERKEAPEGPDLRGIERKGEAEPVPKGRKGTPGKTRACG